MLMIGVGAVVGIGLHPFQEAFNTSEVTVCAWVKRNSGGLTWDAQAQAIAHDTNLGTTIPTAKHG